MEDILASIRRILSEDEAPAAGAQSAARRRRPAGDGVLVLDPAMMVAEPARDAEPAVPEPAVPRRPCRCRPSRCRPRRCPWQRRRPAWWRPKRRRRRQSRSTGLVRTLTDRTTQVRSGGPTIEDIVREEMRPLLKAWLDANLPPLVERLVRAEIERVVGRVVP